MMNEFEQLSNAKVHLLTLTQFIRHVVTLKMKFMFIFKTIIVGSKLDF